MKSAVLFLLLACAFSNCEHLIIGDTSNKSLLYHTVTDYYAIPFVTREKNVFFNSPNQQVISSIMAYDRLHSEAKVIVSAGGVEYTYVNLLLQSERGKGLDYDIGIYS